MVHLNYITQFRCWIYIGTDGHHLERRNGRFLFPLRHKRLHSAAESCKFYQAGQAAFVFNDANHHRQYGWQSPFDYGSVWWHPNNNRGSLRKENLNFYLESY